MSLRAEQASEDDEDTDALSLIGRVLADKYKVTGLLGVGGIGRVYRAEHLGLRRPVALKVLLEHYQCVPELQKRFEREAMALAALSHPNIVTIIDFVSTKDATFMVMELLEGKEIDEILSEGPLSPRDAFTMMEQILSCLAYAHARDVIHRDLKPQNVLVRRLPGGRPHAEILDFGLAKFMDGSGPSANLTKTGLIVGTPAYMAPEQASGSRADQRSDVYAAAVMFFEILTGMLPFEGTEPSELLRHHLLTPAPAVAERCPGARVSPELEAFFARALSKNPAERFTDAGTMLEAFLVLPPESYEPPPENGRKRAPVKTPTALGETSLARPSMESARKLLKVPQLVKRWAIFAAIAAVVVLAIAIIIWTSSGSTDEGAATEEEDSVVETEEERQEEAAIEADPTADEPADAPLEEDEAEPEPPAPPAAQRPSARNPWASRVPGSLSKVRRRIVRGQSMTKGNMRVIASYRRHHPTDVRARLILAQAYESRGWLMASLVQYRRAYRRDPSSRGDPRMMRDLINMSGNQQLHGEAISALLEVYGAEAIPATQRAIERERDPAVRARLEETVRRLHAGQ